MTSIRSRRQFSAVFSAVLLSALAVVAVPLPTASAHNVVCTNDAQQPFFNGAPEPGRAVIEGATIIECTPTAPDAQRTEVQLQWLRAGTWKDKGTSYVTYTNARFHRTYDSTSCLELGRDNWRTKAVHAGKHNNSVVKTDFSIKGDIYCYYNVG